MSDDSDWARAAYAKLNPSAEKKSADATIQAPADKVGITAVQHSDAAMATTLASPKAQSNTPQFDFAVAKKFLRAVHGNEPAALVVGSMQGHYVPQDDIITLLTSVHGTNVWFHCQDLKPEWANPASHAKGKVTTADKSHVLGTRFLWLDCDAEKYVGSDPTEAARHYMLEGASVCNDIDMGLSALDIQPWAKWRSGAGWQGLIKLDAPIAPDEAETLVGKLHIALGFDAVVRNPNRLLRLPGSINYKNGKDGRVPAPCSPCYLYESNIMSVESVRRALANVDQKTTDKQVYTGTTATADLSANPDDYKAPEARDEVFAKLEPWALALGTTGKHPDHTYKSRSEAVFAFVTACVRHSVPDNIIAACLLHWPIGQSVREQPNTRRALKRVLTRAKERAIDADLAAMNEKHAVVKIGGKTLVMTLGRHPLFKGYLMPTYQTFGAFKDLHDKYRKSFKDKDGNPKEVGIGSWWLRSKFRRQFDDGVEFRPDIDSDETPDGRFNLSRGYSVKPQAGNCALFTAHMLDNLCGGNKDYFDYLLKWCAWVVQNPGNKTDVCVVLRSDEEGTGKGFFFKKFGGLFGPHFMQITNLDHLIGKFNPHLEQLRLIFADEAFFAGDARHRGSLYGIITEDPLTIEPKFVGPYPAKNHLNICLATNLAWAIPASSTARRFFVLDVADTHKQDLPYFKAIADQWDAGGAAAFLHTLLTTDLAGFDVRKVPKTDALVVQQARSREGLDAFIEHVCDEGRLPYALRADPSVIITSGEKLNEGFWPWLRNEFPSLKRMTSTLMAHELRRKWDTKHFHRGYVNGIKFPALAALRAKAVAKFGTQIEWSNIDTEWQDPPREADDALPM
jgi:hypothetical protein